MWRTVKTISFLPCIDILYQRTGCCRKQEGPWEKAGLMEGLHTLSLSRHSARQEASIHHSSLFSSALPALSSSFTIDEKVSDQHQASTSFECICRVIPEINLTWIQLTLNVTAVKQRWWGFWFFLCLEYFTAVFSGEMKSQTSSLENKIKTNIGHMLCEINVTILPYLHPVQIWIEQVPHSMSAWHWDVPQCCPEFYSYNLTSNVRALHTERQLNPCLPLTILEKKKLTLLCWRATTGHFVYKKAIVDVMSPENGLCKDLHPSFVVLSGWCLHFYQAGWKTGWCVIGIMWQTCISADKQPLKR